MDDGLAAAHPRLQLTLSHVWPWGLVTIADPDALDPPSGEGPVTADGHWVVLHVAHEPDGGDERQAHVHVEVRETAPPRTARRVLYDHVLRTPRGVVAIGDSEQPVLVPTHPERTAVRVSVRPGDVPDRLGEVWVELGPDPYAER